MGFNSKTVCSVFFNLLLCFNLRKRIIICHIWCWNNEMMIYYFKEFKKDFFFREKKDKSLRSLTRKPHVLTEKNINHKWLLPFSKNVQIKTSSLFRNQAFIKLTMITRINNKSANKMAMCLKRINWRKKKKWFVATSCKLTILLVRDTLILLRAFVGALIPLALFYLSIRRQSDVTVVWTN